MTSETNTYVPARDADTTRPTELVAMVDRTQREEDVEGFLTLFAPDAVWVNGAGPRLVGLDEIADFTRSVLPGAMANESARYGPDPGDLSDDQLEDAALDYTRWVVR